MTDRSENNDPGMRPDREAVKVMRLERGWSQAKLAEKAGVDESTIKNVEGGRTKTTHPDTLARIARALEVDLDRGCAMEAANFGVLCATEDKAEGMAAFVEKRKPVFKGR